MIRGAWGQVLRSRLEKVEPDLPLSEAPAEKYMGKWLRIQQRKKDEEAGLGPFKHDLTNDLGPWEPVVDSEEQEEAAIPWSEFIWLEDAEL